MTECNNETYGLKPHKFVSGFSSIGNSHSVHSWVIVTKNKLDPPIANVPSSIRYVKDVSGFLWWKTTDEYLVGDNLPKTNIKDILIKFQNGKFAIIDSNNNNILTEISDFTLTGYGKGILGKCFGNTLEYHALTNDSHDYSNCETDHDLATNLDIL